MSASTVRTITKPKANYETTAWKWMRYSGFLLIPLVWGHVYYRILLSVFIKLILIMSLYVGHRLAGEFTIHFCSGLLSRMEPMGFGRY